MLDLNHDFGNNALQFNPQMATLLSQASQSTATRSSLSFSDILASAQAESNHVQDGTGDSPFTVQPFQIAPRMLMASSHPAESGTATQARSMQDQRAAAADHDNDELDNDESDPDQRASSATARPVDQTTGSATGQVAVSPAPDQSPTTKQGSVNSQASPFTEPNHVYDDSKDLKADEAGLPVVAETQPLHQSNGPVAQDTVSAAGSPLADPFVTNSGQADSTAESYSPAETNLAPAQNSPLVQSANQSPNPTDSGAAHGSTREKIRAVANAGVSQPPLSAPLAMSAAKAPEKSKGGKEAGRAESKTGLAGGTSSATADVSLLPSPSASVGNLNTAGGTDGGGTTSHSASIHSALTSNDQEARGGGSNTDLAFALKIQGTSSMNNSGMNNLGSQASLMSTPAPDNLGTTLLPASNAFAAEFAGINAPAESKAVLKAVFSPAGGGSSLQFNPASIATSQAAFAGENSEPVAADEVVAAATLPEEQAVSSQPVKTVQVQITGADDQKVDLKLVEKGGALTMSVRSADGLLTKALQQNLPDLTAKLSDQQIRAEWWRPDAPPADAKNSNGSSGGGNQSASQDEGSQNKGNSGQQGGRNSREPDWLEDLSILNKAAPIGSNSETSNQDGTQFSWHL